MAAIAYWHSIAEEDPIKGYMTSCLIDYTLAAFSEKTRTDGERSSETSAVRMIEDVLARRVPPIDQIPKTWPFIIDTNWDEEAQEALDLFNKKDSIEYSIQFFFKKQGSDLRCKDLLSASNLKRLTINLRGSPFGPFSASRRLLQIPYS